ncbi:MAG TPA: hypothetical protein GX743_05190, partial [Actinomycetales bacterium]|nr:hypothetical protein [Actinomycetales bacterium]
MSRLRVHELAKQLGRPSKEILAKLDELGEYVKNASSSLEAPVIRRVREAFPPLEEKPAKKPAAKAAPKAAPAAPKKSAPTPGPATPTPGDATPAP